MSHEFTEEDIAAIANNCFDKARSSNHRNCPTNPHPSRLEPHRCRNMQDLWRRCRTRCRMHLFTRKPPVVVEPSSIHRAFRLVCHRVFVRRKPQLWDAIRSTITGPMPRCRMQRRRFSTGGFVQWRSSAGDSRLCSTSARCWHWRVTFPSWF